MGPVNGLAPKERFSISKSFRSLVRVLYLPSLWLIMICSCLLSWYDCYDGYHYDKYYKYVINSLKLCVILTLTGSRRTPNWISEDRQIVMQYLKFFSCTCTFVLVFSSTLSIFRNALLDIDYTMITQPYEHIRNLSAFPFSLRRSRRFPILSFVWSLKDFHLCLYKNIRCNIPLHIPRGRHLPAVRAVQGRVSVGFVIRWKCPPITCVHSALRHEAIPTYI